MGDTWCHGKKNNTFCKNVDDDFDGKRLKGTDDVTWVNNKVKNKSNEWHEGRRTEDIRWKISDGQITETQYYNCTHYLPITSITIAEHSLPSSSANRLAQIAPSQY